MVKRSRYGAKASKQAEMKTIGGENQTTKGKRSQSRRRGEYFFIIFDVENQCTQEVSSTNKN